jgi:hypothetical protein
MVYVSKGRKEERFPKLPSGKYMAELVETTFMNHEMLGDYQSVQWKIKSPADYKGQYLWEKFYFNNPDFEKAEKDQIRYETFLRDVGGIEKGGKDDPDLLLNKVCELDVYRGEIKSEPGTFYNHVNKRTPVDKMAFTAKGSGISTPQAPTSTAEELDDEIPF